MVKYKIILGIVLPLSIIIILTILGSVDSGLSIEENFPQVIGFDKIFSEDKVRTYIDFGTIDIKNEYFLGKRVELPNYEICLNDQHDIREPIDAGTLYYAEGEYSINDDFIFDGYARSSTKNVEVKAYGERSVTIFLNPQYYITGKKSDSLIEQYGDYDELLVINVDNIENYRERRYRICQTLTKNDKARAKQILIIK